MWRYDEGDVTHIGMGHSGAITGIKISPDGEHIVSVSNDGAIMRWKFPYTAVATPPVPPLALETSQTPQQEPEPMLTSPKQEVQTPQEVDSKVTSPTQKVMSPSAKEAAMEVGGATPKQEE